jgi:outer membrane protein assembly factor BamD
MKPFSIGISAVLALCGCASFGTFAGTSEGTVVYGADAEENLKKGDEAMESRNYPEAAQYFEFVKTKYPYLEAAKTAELKLADSEFARDRFTEARDRYQNFVRLHPTHPQVDYSAYRAALTHYKDIPSDFFLLPPASEKDQSEVKNALSAMVDFLRAYPKSSFVPEAETALREVKRRLTEHELYVANFYAKREKWTAVAARLASVAKTYGGVGYDEQIYSSLTDAYLKLSDTARARETLTTFIAKYPSDEGVARAKRRLEELPPVSIPDAGT